ncbi:hypothetical protein [Natrinema sp. DC36]|uniref:hypothetical protein n=1 Tax=Natrinema sp. DC36 TaxID=2878680 RepID=UPI001CF052A8|nr:hypothetical protein [Natrinema sp. DC36]
MSVSDYVGVGLEVTLEEIRYLEKRERERGREKYLPPKALGRSASRASLRASLPRNARSLRCLPSESRGSHWPPLATLTETSAGDDRDVLALSKPARLS